MDLCILLNDDLAQTVQSHPKRFVGLGTLPMQAPDLAVLEMRRCVKELGFPGVQIGSHINNWDLNAPELFPFYAVRHFMLYYFFMVIGVDHTLISVYHSVVLRGQIVIRGNKLVSLCAMQAAEELGCSIFVHPWDMQTDGRMAKYWLPWLVGEGDEMK